MDIKSKNLLVISHSYNDFQKDTTITLSKYFNNVSVLVRYNPIANISKYIDLPQLKQFNLSTKIDTKNNPSNISVYPTPVIYTVSDSQYKNLGQKHFKAVESAINKNNIQFDIIHSHFTWSSGYVGAKLKEKYNVPFVVTAHGYDIYDLPFRDAKWKQNIEYVLNTADYIFTVSNSNLKCIKRLNVKTPVKVLPNGYRSELFYPRSSNECRKKLSLPLDKMIILTVGNLVEIKGHRYLIEAMCEVVKHRKDVLCIIVGDGKLKNKLEKQINKLGLKDYFILAGGKPHDEIPIWINSCDFFVLPSLKEGNPTVMFECLGCGKPFIGTKVGGVPEIIVSDDYGLLVEPRNSIDLAEKIDLALKNKWNSKKIREYGTTFTWDKVSRAIYTIYFKTLKV